VAPAAAPTQHDERAEVLADQLVAERIAANQTIAALEEEIAGLRAAGDVDKSGSPIAAAGLALGGIGAGLASAAASVRAWLSFCLFKS